MCCKHWAIVEKTFPYAGMLWQNLAKTWALCGFQGVNFIYTELRGLVMCQQCESAFEAPRQASKNTRPNPTLHSTFRCRTSEC